MAGAEFAMALDALWADYDQRAAFRWPARLAVSIPIAAAHGLTIVPGAFHFSLDVRAYDEAVLAELEPKVGRIIDGIEQRRAVRFHLGQPAPGRRGPGRSGIQRVWRPRRARQGIPVLRIGSPASHDAAAFAAAGVPMGMVFVRNENGSHNPYRGHDDR